MSGKKTSRQLAVASNKRRKMSPGAAWKEAVVFDGNGAAERGRKANAIEIEHLKKDLARTKESLKELEEEKAAGGGGFVAGMGNNASA